MRRCLLVAAALFGMFASPARAAPDYTALNQAAVQAHILPRYAVLSAATAKFASIAADGCADRMAWQAGWAEAMRAWQGVQHLRFGPVLLFNRYQRFAFWPDARNSMPRQLNEIFATKRLPDFAIGSIAVQGLSALERNLFDATEAAKLNSDAFRCAWAQAAAQNLAEMAAAIEQDWRSGRHYAAQFVAAKGDLVAFAGPQEATQELFKALYGAIELVADHKLARPLGKGGRDARPMAAEHWRSGLSGAAIGANIAAARELYASFAPQLADAGLRGDLQRRFDDLAQRSAGLDLDRDITDAPRRPELEKLRADLLALKTQLGERLAPALGLQIGFNALDGD